MQNPPHDYAFYTTCVDSPDGQLISAMQEAAVAVTYETMLAHCRNMLDVAVDLGYERRSTSGHGLTLKNDWAVSYHKSTYAGCPCYYFVWSHIEHIWVKDGCQPKEAYREDPTNILARRNPRDLTAKDLKEIEQLNKGRFDYKFVAVKMGEAGDVDDDDDNNGAAFPTRRNPPSSIRACETFHGDGACEDYTEKQLWMPGPIVLMGDCIDCGYDVTNRRSKKDGRYVHDHKAGVKLYRRADDGERPSKTLAPPRQVFVLGSWLGCTYDDGAGQQELMGSSRIKACTDNGKRLFAIHSTKGCLYVVSGGSFHIRDWMYD